MKKGTKTHMRKVIRIKAWQSRMLLVILFMAVFALAETTKPVNGMAPWGIPLKVEILTQPSLTSFGVTHDGNPLYLDDTLTGAVDNVSAYTGAGSSLIMYVSTNRYVLVDFSDRVDSATSLCDDPNAGPISIFLPAFGPCVLQWPQPDTNAFQLYVGGMFKGSLSPGQTVYKDAFVRFGLPGIGQGYYTLAWDQPLAVTLVSSDGTRMADTAGADTATLDYWNGKRPPRVQIIGTFNVPLQVQGTPCPNGVCP